MLHYHHKLTDTTVETKLGQVGDDITYNEVRFESGLVTTEVTHYSHLDGPVSQNVLLYGSVETDAYVQSGISLEDYVVVNVSRNGNGRNVGCFLVPMSIAEAIAAALAGRVRKTAA